VGSRYGGEGKVVILRLVSTRGSFMEGGSRVCLWGKELLWGGNISLRNKNNRRGS